MAATKKVGVHGTDAETGRDKKNPCPVTRKEFKGSAKPVLVTIKHGDEEAKVVLDVKEFTTGSFGWFANDKVPLTIGGMPVKVQANLGLTVVNSKEAPAE